MQQPPPPTLFLDATAPCLPLLWPASAPAIVHISLSMHPKAGNHAVILSGCWDHARLMCSGFAAEPCLREAVQQRRRCWR